MPAPCASRNKPLIRLHQKKREAVRGAIELEFSVVSVKYLRRHDRRAGAADGADGPG